MAGIQGLSREGLASAPLTLTHSDTHPLSGKRCSREDIFPDPPSNTCQLCNCELKPECPLSVGALLVNNWGLCGDSRDFLYCQSEANRKAGMLISYSFPSSQLILGTCGLGWSLSQEPAEGHAASPWTSLWSARTEDRGILLCRLAVNTECTVISLYKQVVLFSSPRNRRGSYLLLNSDPENQEVINISPQVLRLLCVFKSIRNTRKSAEQGKCAIWAERGWQGPD